MNADLLIPGVHRQVSRGNHSEGVENIFHRNLGEKEPHMLIALLNMISPQV